MERAHGLAHFVATIESGVRKRHLHGGFRSTRPKLAFDLNNHRSTVGSEGNDHLRHYEISGCPVRVADLLEADPEYILHYISAKLLAISLAFGHLGGCPKEFSYLTDIFFGWISCARITRALDTVHIRSEHWVVELDGKRSGGGTIRPQTSIEESIFR